MGKINPVSAKYIIHATIRIDGVVDRPDVIGAIFGQTEGLLGADLELRELQRSGRIGRIEVDSETRSGKTNGTIIIPSSLDKAETAIVAASLEIIQRIGPCNAKIQVINIEDIRISKRKFVVDRAKELLKTLVDTVMPDSQEISDEVAASVRVMEIQEYGKERLPAGPAIDESDEITIVEGRADVLNLLKHGIKNAIAINGTSIPPEIVDIVSSKVVTVFVDGDRGGDLIIQELLSMTDIDFVAKAPDGKEVEEITKKEIHKALRARITAEQYKLELGNGHHHEGDEQRKEQRENRRQQQQQKRAPPQQGAQQAAAQPQPRQAAQPAQAQQPAQASSQQKPKIQKEAPVAKKNEKELPESELKKYEEMLDSLVGTRGAYILDAKLEILGKVPISELESTIKSLPSGVHAIVFDGVIEKELVAAAEKSNIQVLIGMDAKVKTNTEMVILTVEDF